VLAFRKFAQSLFGRPPLQQVSAPRKLFLAEFNSVTRLNFSFAYLALNARSSGSETWSYFWDPWNSEPAPTFKRLVKAKIKWALRLGALGTYRAYGFSRHIEVAEKRRDRENGAALASKFFSSHPSKRDLLAYRFDDVLIGDLIYDTWLSARHQTVDLSSAEFRRFFSRCCSYASWWSNFLSKNYVSGLVVSHPVYMWALPARLLNHLGTRAYVSALKRVDIVTEASIDEPHNFPSDFQKMFPQERTRALGEAKEFLEGRVQGEKDIFETRPVNRPFAPQAMSQAQAEQTGGPEIRILVAVHSFFDAPHFFGLGIFEDVYEWLQFLAELSRETSFTWLVKPHPFYAGEPTAAIEKIFESAGNCEVISPSVTHSELISGGLNAVLTIWGTVGIDFAYLGVPVINAHTNNPHCAYQFNLHPRTKVELREAILNIPTSISLEISETQVLENLYMKRFFYSNNIFLDSYPDFANFIEKDAFSTRENEAVGHYLRKNISSERHSKNISVVSDFMAGEERRLFLRS